MLTSTSSVSVVTNQKFDLLFIQTQKDLNHKISGSVLKQWGLGAPDTTYIQYQKD